MLHLPKLPKKTFKETRADFYMLDTHHIYTHTRLMALFSWTTWVSRYQKGKPIWILLKQGTVSSSGISWVICKSAPHSRQTTIPTPHHSVFTGRMPFLPPNQQCWSTEGSVCITMLELHSKRNWQCIGRRPEWCQLACCLAKDQEQYATGTVTAVFTYILSTLLVNTNNMQETMNTE